MNTDKHRFSGGTWSFSAISPGVLFCDRILQIFFLLCVCPCLSVAFSFFFFQRRERLR